MSEKVNLFDATVTRRIDGLEFKLQSKPIEEAMRLVSGGRTGTTRDGHQWGDNLFYNLELGANGIPIAFPGFTEGRFDLWGTRELVLNRGPKLNLSILLAVGLGDGVTIKIPTVISEPQLNTYTEGLKAAVRQFYVDFLKESKKTIRITTEEIT